MDKIHLNNDKSFVTIARRICLICNQEYETNELLLDQKLRNRFDRFTTIGTGLCPEHTKEGYICLIAIDPTKSDCNGGTIKSENVYRTGIFVHIKTEVFEHIFNVKPKPIMYVEESVIDILSQMTQK